MNTFGLKRKVNTFWLGRLQLEITEAWKEIVSFVGHIKRNIKFYLER